MDKDSNSNVEGKNNPSNKQRNRTLMGVLSYVGPLVIVSYFTAKDDPFIKFHVKQGLVLFVIEIIVYVFATMFWSFLILAQLVNLALLVLSIIGIINVSQGKEKMLPWVGHFSKYFSF